MSYPKECAKERRDFRQGHGDPEVPKHRRAGGRVKPCKKGPNKVHSFKTKLIYGFMEWEVCEFCGKHK